MLEAFKQRVIRLYSRNDSIRDLIKVSIRVSIQERDFWRNCVQCIAKDKLWRAFATNVGFIYNKYVQPQFKQMSSSKILHHNTNLYESNIIQTAILLWLAPNASSIYEYFCTPCIGMSRLETVGNMQTTYSPIPGTNWTRVLWTCYFDVSIL